MNRRTTGISIVIQTLMLLVSGGSYTLALPVVSEWLTASNGNWTTASNWSTNPVYPRNGVPTAADEYNVLIDETGAPYTVTLNTDVTLSGVKLDSPDATLKMLGHLSANSFDVTRGAVTIAKLVDRSIVKIVPSPAFVPREWPSSIRPSAVMSFRNAVSVPESYRIDEF